MRNVEKDERARREENAVAPALPPNGIAAVGMGLQRRGATPLASLPAAPTIEGVRPTMETGMGDRVVLEQVNDDLDIRIGPAAEGATRIVVIALSADGRISGKFVRASLDVSVPIAADQSDSLAEVEERARETAVEFLTAAIAAIRPAAAR